MISFFGRHLIAQQYLGVLLARSFMLLVAATGYVFSILHVLFTKKKNLSIQKIYPDCSIFNTYRPSRSYPILDTPSHLSQFRSETRSNPNHML